MALTLSRSVSTTATSRAARSSRARAAVSVKPMAFHYDTRRYRACRPSMTPYRSPLIAGLGFIGPMLASEWLAKSVQQQSPSMDISTREEEYTLSADCPGKGSTVKPLTLFCVICSIALRISQPDALSS